jgi:hypothetical protein
MIFFKNSMITSRYRNIRTPNERSFQTRGRRVPSSVETLLPTFNIQAAHEEAKGGASEQRALLVAKSITTSAGQSILSVGMRVNANDNNKNGKHSKET